MSAAVALRWGIGGRYVPPHMASPTARVLMAGVDVAAASISRETTRMVVANFIVTGRVVELLIQNVLNYNSEACIRQHRMRSTVHISCHTSGNLHRLINKFSRDRLASPRSRKEGGKRAHEM
jgi:hypothetical protein